MAGDGAAAEHLVDTRAFGRVRERKTLGREANAAQPRVGERPLVRADTEVVTHADRRIEGQLSAERARRDVRDPREDALHQAWDRLLEGAALPRTELEPVHRGLLVR